MIVFDILISQGRMYFRKYVVRVVQCEQEEWAAAERLSDEAGGEWTDRWGYRRAVKGDHILAGRALRECQRVRNLAQ